MKQVLLHGTSHASSFSIMKSEQSDCMRPCGGTCTCCSPFRKSYVSTHQCPRCTIFDHTQHLRISMTVPYRHLAQYLDLYINLPTGNWYRKRNRLSAHVSSSSMIKYNRTFTMWWMQPAIPTQGTYAAKLIPHVICMGSLVYKVFACVFTGSGDVRFSAAFFLAFSSTRGKKPCLCMFEGSGSESTANVVSFTNCSVFRDHFHSHFQWQWM